ncbi:MAG: ABC transporter ATP-binding protein [Bacteroidales bacterium]|jgi:ABC-type Fe3+/spermidine/putrescine transport system ATPase subunit
MLKLEKINRKMGAFALSEVSIEIQDGEYFVLLGRSGSGKTRLLEIIAGLLEPDSGRIYLDGEDITKTSIQRRNIGMVFQDYAIFPNMTVFANIAYSLHCRKYTRDAIQKEVYRMADDMNISHLLNRFTHDLSGGELQRVALARTLITSPGLLLLDEPLASIDASLKDEIKRIFRRLNRNGLTIIHVTHDYNEAVSLASRIGVIHNGHIIQIGSPDEVFGRPVNRFVARYSGIRNFFRVRFINEGGKWKAVSDSGIDFTMSGDDCPPEGLVIIKSNAINVSCTESADEKRNQFMGTVNEINPTEHGFELMIDAGDTFYADISINDFRKMKIEEEAQVWISFAPEDCIALPGSL